MKVWKMQAVCKDPETGEILARATKKDEKTGEDIPAYKYAKEATAKEWIADVGSCKKYTEIINGKPVIVLSGVDVVDKNCEVPDDFRAHARATFRFTPGRTGISSIPGSGTGAAKGK